MNGTEPEAKRMKKGEMIELDEDDLALYGDTIADLKVRKLAKEYEGEWWFRLKRPDAESST